MQIIKKLKWIILCALIMFIPSGDLIAKQAQSSHKATHHHSHSHKKGSSHNKKHSSSHKKQSHKQKNFSNNKKKPPPKNQHSSQRKNTPKKNPPSQTKKPNSHSKAPNVNQSNYQNHWYKSTFPTNEASINYHTNKHGNGRSSLKYTQDAVNFYENNKHLRRPFQLQDGSSGYKINKGSAGGIWTESGKVVTFWG